MYDPKNNLLYWFHLYIIFIVIYILINLDMFNLRDAIEIFRCIHLWSITKLNEIAVLDSVSPIYTVALASFINQDLLQRWPFKNILPEVYTYLQRSNFFEVIGVDVNQSIYSWWSQNLIEISPILDREQNLGGLGGVTEICAKLFVRAKELAKDDTSWKEFLDNLENTLLMAISELVDNVGLHSEADLQQKASMYMLQHFPSVRQTRLAIIDNWIWIIESLKNSIHYKEGADNQYYMELAIQRLITNWKWRWNWLAIVSEIIKETDSVLEIYSWDVLYTQNWQEKNFEYTWVYYPWTMINIKFNMIAIEQGRRDWLESFGHTNMEMEDYDYYDDIFN